MFVVSKKSSAEFRQKIGEKVREEVEVVDDARAEDSALVICILKGMKSDFEDNLEGHCVACGREVIFRPHAPKKPPKVCFKCAPALIKEIERLKREEPTGVPPNRRGDG